MNKNTDTNGHTHTHTQNYFSKSALRDLLNFSTVLQSLISGLIEL